MLLLRRGIGVGSDRSIERFPEDVGLAGVPTHLSKQVDEDVEQGSLDVLPAHRGRGLGDARRAWPERAADTPGLTGPTGHMTC